jgi:hypothetical protein
VAAAGPVAERIAADPEERRRWVRCGGTWFAGVNVLPNDARGAIPEEGVPPLTGSAAGLGQAAAGVAPVAWDRAQVSVCYPGYPQPWAGETPAAFGFRRNRDAAHVDGILRDADGRRRLGETHGFVLGIPLGSTHPDAAPLTVWEGSHHLVREALTERLAGIPADEWSGQDITEAYTAARRMAFERCRRVCVHVQVGAAYLVHRLAVHGVAPWTAPEGSARSIAYFRPDPFAGRDPDWWLAAP